MNIALETIGVSFLAVSVFFMIRQKLPAYIFAFMALCILHISTAICLPVSTFIFWGIASLIVLVIDLLSPKGDPDGSWYGNLYLAVGALAGLFIGMSIDAAIMILCTIIGTAFGQFAYSRTPKGCWVKFPSSIFIHYFCAKGFKVIATTAMIGIALEGFIRNLGR